MNRVTLMGRLTRDPNVSESKSGMKIARYTMAVDRKTKKDDGQNADFISIVAFDKSAEFAEKYLYKGIKMLISGHIQTGSYNKDGQTIYTTDVVVDEQEFCESKKNSSAGSPSAKSADGFMAIPDGVEDEGLPFF